LYVKRSALDRYSEQPNGRVKELLAQGDPTVAHLEAAHEEHSATLDEVKTVLADLGAEVTKLSRRAPFDDTDFDIVVTVGGDGTLLHASHNVADTPVLGINSAPTTSVGFFCGTRRGEVEPVLRSALRGNLKRVSLARMQVTLDGEIVDARVLNDALFCHRSPAATSRYIVEKGDTVEEQKSSGFWLGPAAGSTAAQRSAGGKVLPFASRKLQLVVREPYTPHGESYSLAHALIEPGESLLVRSKSRDMRMYLDGPDNMTKVGLGQVLVFELSSQPLTLLGISARRKWAQET
jgi:NAD+ kinase